MRRMVMQSVLLILKQLKEKMIRKGYGYKTQQFYMDTVKAFISFHGKRDPSYMGMVEIDLFMNHLTRDKGILFRKKQQVFQVLMFFYTQVLHISLQNEYIDASRGSQLIPKADTHKMVQSIMQF